MEIWDVKDFSKLKANKHIQKAAEILRSGGLVAFPTETVYGLGANAMDSAAVHRIFKAKGRPQDNPLIAHVADVSGLELLCRDIPPAAYTLCELYWPGPLTLVLRSSGKVAPEVSAGLDTIAVRSPNHPVANALISACDIPIAAPSANISGSPSPTEARHVHADLDGKIDAILDGGSCKVGLESTVLDLVSDPPRILRPGGITLEQIKKVCSDAVYDEAVFSEVSPNTMVRSPGMKYRHYAPQADMIILRGNSDDAARFIRSRAALNPNIAVLCYQEELPLYKGLNAVSYGPEVQYDILSQNLYSALRALDEAEPDIIFARCPEGNDAAAAIENRLKRASAHHIIDLSDISDIGGGNT
ncbi:MAG: threonylcarbamoyl-AMP synthase [Clostridiales bacterium]|jgi:L-threonylcarbamoyladenylate synthase|nr:threonylcarbamoyl-AMP synthase [Clostridiales bacterium]